jgi:hypothetical protein
MNSLISHQSVEIESDEDPFDAINAHLDTEETRP